MKRKLISSALALSVMATASTALAQSKSVKPKRRNQSQTSNSVCETQLNHEIQEKVRQIIADELGVAKKKVTPKACFKNLGADSLDMVELIIRTEEEFGIEIPDKDAEKLTCVCDVYKYLEQHVGKLLKQ